MSRTQKVYFFRGLSSALPAQSIRARVIKASTLHDKFFVTDLHNVQKKINAWKDHLGWIEPHYAVKANDSDTLLRHLFKNNISFDVASSAEMLKCIRLGVPPTNLIYSNPMKTEADLREAKRLCIRLTVFDSLSEIHKIRRQQGEGAEVLMRIKVEDHDAQVLFSHRFGAERYEWQEFFQNLEMLGLIFRGVSFHVGSGIEGGRAGMYDKAIHVAADALHAAELYGFSNSNILNIGGGFGAEEDIELMGSVLSRCRHGLDQYRWMAEPGRYFAAESQIAVAQVLLVKPANENRKQQITLNDGIYGTFSCIPFDHSGLLRSDDFPEDENGQLCTNVVPTQVFGPSCDGYDVLAQNLPVPADIEVGDFLAFAGMGAYTRVCATSFNGISLSRELKDLKQDIA